MQQLNRDQAQIQTQQVSEGLTLADVVGFDQDTPFKQMMQFTISNDINHISVGGQTNLGENANFTVRLMEEGGLHDLMSYGLVFNCSLGNPAIGAWTVNSPLTGGSDATHNYFFQNALQLFEAVYLKIGQKQIALAKHDIYQQLYMYSLNKAAIEPYSWGLGLDTQEYDDAYDGTVSASNATGLGYGTILQKKAKQVVVRTNNVSTAIFAAQTANLLGDNSFFVPLFLIVPELLTIDQQIYTAMGQTIEVGIRSQSANKCVFNYQGLDNGSLGKYSIMNISLVRQFAMLDSVHNDMVKRSEIMIKPVQSMQFNVSPISSSINLNFAISRGSKMRQLLFCFCPTTAGQGDGSQANLSAVHMQSWQKIATSAAASGIPNFVWSPLSLFLALPIQQIEIDAAGDRVVYNSQQISCLQNLSGSQTHNTLGDFMDSYHGNSVVSGLERNVKQIFRVDLDRFPIDEIGSTAQGQVQVLVKIVLNTGVGNANQNLLYTTDTFAGNLNGITSALQCQAYLEYQDEVHIDHGIYR